MKKTILFLLLQFSTLLLFAQEINVSGNVTASDDGSLLTGVNVIVTGTGKGAITNINGSYSISVPQGKTLTFSYVGYQSQTLKVTGNILNVILEPNTQMLNEVVAIGYGTMRKSDVTGAISSVKGDDIKKVQAADPLMGLQGKATGVTIVSNNGQPGSSPSVFIRGIGTIGDNSPIYVVDGLIVSDIKFLSSNDIESIEVLKDASSTAIYGSRGANGVVLVSTKKGKAGSAKINFDSYFGVQNRWKKLDVMKSKEFAETMIKIGNIGSEMNFYNTYGFNKWLAAYRLGKSPYYPVLKSDLNPDGFDYSAVETDWQDEVFKKNATIQNYYISVNGGTEKDKYSLSASWFDQQGTIIGSYYNRLTLRLNSSHQLRNWITLGEDISYVTSTGRNAMNNNASPGASILSAALAMAPWDPTHYPDGTQNINGKDLSGQIAASSNFRNVTNPFSMVENSHPKDVNNNWIGNIYIELTPIKKLSIRSALNFNFANNSSLLYKDGPYTYSDYDKATTNYLSSSLTNTKYYILENTATYKDKIGKHDFSIMGGQTTEQYSYYTIGGSGATIYNATSENWLLSKTTTDRTFAGDGIDRNRMFSLLGRIFYSYDNKYLITSNFRADASSKFPQHLWGYFPSFALGWRISEEPWMKNNGIFDQLKLRAGWGRIGNQSISSNLFVTTMFNSGPTFVDYVFGKDQQLASGATVLTYANEDGKWEVTEQTDLGIDFSILNNTLSGTIDLFNRDTKDMLLYVSTPANVGNRYLPMANVGTVRNKGIEFALNYRNNIGKVNYNVSGNISFINNKLMKLNGGDRIYDGYSIIDEGYSLWTFWGYKYEGIYKDDASAAYFTNINFKAGDAIYADSYKDNKLDDKDKTDLGNPFPKFTYGLNLACEYLGFDVTAMFQGTQGNKAYNDGKRRLEGTGYEFTLGTQMRDVWTSSNPNGSIPNPNNSSNSFVSSRFIEDASYLRLKNLQIGYTLPSNVARQIFMERCRFYLTATNLLTFTKYSGYDPEIGSRGVDYLNYPTARVVTLGVNFDIK
ncbi:conserved exported hypothetical protein [uncultured Paludibacter sp.]|uniref:Uncharacterized protein n=1 Tax=uncultured Paludibacter sp. TaxID=497635 RepID=A0A653AJZ3_9BACT|nr:conserved exported hypothetical protein [uncultured Paludibacter sp.]